MLESVKKFFVNMYFEKGYKIGMYLLKNIGITAVFIALMIIFTSDVKLTFAGLLEWLVTLPIFSIFVMAVRIAIKLIHKIFPMNPGIVKIIFDFVIFIAVTVAFGMFIGNIPMPDSNFLQMLIVSVFDLLYVGLIAFLLLSKKQQEKKIETEIGE